mgnify:CR=1 FL=1
MGNIRKNLVTQEGSITIKSIIINFQSTLLKISFESFVKGYISAVLIRFNDIRKIYNLIDSKANTNKSNSLIF